MSMRKTMVLECSRADSASSPNGRKDNPGVVFFDGHIIHLSHADVE